jgi:hypothetical protein
MGVRGGLNILFNFRYEQTLPESGLKNSEILPEITRTGPKLANYFTV